MGYKSVGICTPLATQIACLLYINVLNHLKTILMFMISLLHLIMILQNTLSLVSRTIKVCLHSDKSSSSDGDRPSPSLVPLPPRIITQSINKKLPLVLYGQHLVENSRKANRNPAFDSLITADGGERICVVCRNMVEASHEIRELPNCCHVFHAECLDGWMDQGRFTCPLCREKLEEIDDEEEVLKGEGGSCDPWRKERMVYLFGEDFVMS